MAIFDFMIIFKNYLKKVSDVMNLHNGYSSKYQVVLKSTLTYSLRKKCPYSELFWSKFSRIRTDYGEIRSVISILHVIYI